MSRPHRRNAPVLDLRRKAGVANEVKNGTTNIGTE
jgi:hypothetical protein